MARDDRGAGGVLAVAIVAVTVLCAVSVLGLGSALAARQRLVAAADAASLAAADALLGAVAGDPCALAAEVATAHRVALARCTTDGADARVEVRLEVLGMPVTATSRAGPAP
ncbi:MAG: flp pilus-assembly TadE/G-like family protein [Protaetiibacter sp.]